MSRTLNQWLAYQQQIHPQNIALGLERIRAVADRLGPAVFRPAPRVITVAGTNGKGSSVAILRSLLEIQGQRVGCYTSPHLLRYNERIRLPDGEVDDQSLVDWFERIEAARAGVPLTFFEYGTLAALGLLSEARLDVAVLEVGLGGRLDAVNLVDADAALITTIDLDHQEWLGPDRESIGREKAGVLRPGQWAVYADPEPVRSVAEVAAARGTRLLRPGRDYRFWREGSEWCLHHRGVFRRLPWPAALLAPAQIHNLAACVVLLDSPDPPWLPSTADLVRAMADVTIPARLQRLAEAPELLLDIAHNPQAARSLQQWLAQAAVKSPTVALFGALADKDAEQIVRSLAASIDHWVLLGLDDETPRGLSGAQLAARLPDGLNTEIAADAHDALARARARAGASGRILAFGSFYLAAAVLRETEKQRSG